MFHKVSFVILILSVVFLGILLHHFSQTSDLLSKYQKLGLFESSLKYEKVEKSWGDQGLIFYQVQFPFIEVPVHSDKMSLFLEDSGMKLKLKNAKIKVTEGLKNLYNSEMADNLNSYVPYKDFTNQILTSMAIMGIDEFVGDIAINTFYSDAKTMRFNIDMEQENQPTLQMKGTLHIPIIGAHQISDLWNGEIDIAEIKLKENLFQKYVNYAKSRKIQQPSSFQKGILKLKQPFLKLKDMLK